MKRQSTNRLLAAVVLSIAVIVLSGCTEEKAQALYSATKSFQLEANRAIDGYEALFVAAAKRPETTEQERINKFLEQARAKGQVEAKDAINHLDLKQKDTAIATMIAEDLSEIRIYYDEFKGSLERLPQASFLARSQVACAAEITVRLSMSMVNYAENLRAKPVRLIRRENDYTNALNQAIQLKNTSEQVRATKLLIDLANERFDLTDRAIRQSLVAAETGARVADLARRYEELSVGDVLALINKGLEIANSVKGVDLDVTLQRASDLKAKLENDKHWKEILAIKFGSDGSPCKPSTETK